MAKMSALPMIIAVGDCARNNTTEPVTSSMMLPFVIRRSFSTAPLFCDKTRDKAGRTATNRVMLTAARSESNKPALIQARNAKCQ